MLGRNMWRTWREIQYPRNGCIDRNISWYPNCYFTLKINYVPYHTWEVPSPIHFSFLLTLLIIIFTTAIKYPPYLSLGLQGRKNTRVFTYSCTTPLHRPRDYNSWHPLLSPALHPFNSRRKQSSRILLDPRNQWQLFSIPFQFLPPSPFI